ARFSCGHRAGGRAGRPTPRDRAKSAVLARYFTVVADRRARGRRVTVYERNRQGPPARHAPRGGRA
ncbi:hypothetical protein ABZX50_33670, partial [Streptomyces misionensis]|uniref:hypothetical protein n=1 Tax=Streptomyces misionensis TaxID=67331 RepID=UPI0033B91CED